jgi:biopolymer transport protein ExbB/TolQ
MNEQENDFGFIQIAMTLLGIMIAGGTVSFSFDAGLDWLSGVWLALCKSMNALGVALYEFIQWLLMMIVIGALTVAAIYVVFLLAKFIYDVTWKRLDRHDRNIGYLLHNREELERQIIELASEMKAMRSKHSSVLSKLSQATRDLEDYTGLKAQKEADKLAAAFEKQQKELQASEERGV